MSTTLLLKRGNTSQTSTFTGLSGEVTIDTDKNTVIVHDGSTAGGHEISGSDDYARPHSNAGFTHANAGFTHANSAFEAANNATDTYASGHANAAFDLANTNAGLLSTSQDYGLITSSANATADYGSIT